MTSVEEEQLKSRANGTKGVQTGKIEGLGKPANSNKKRKVPVVRMGGRLKTCALPLEALFSLSRPLLALPTWSLK